MHRSRWWLFAGLMSIGLIGNPGAYGQTAGIGNNDGGGETHLQGQPYSLPLGIRVCDIQTEYEFEGQRYLVQLIRFGNEITSYRAYRWDPAGRASRFFYRWHDGALDASWAFDSWDPDRVNKIRAGGRRAGPTRVEVVSGGCR